MTSHVIRLVDVLASVLLRRGELEFERVMNPFVKQTMQQHYPCGHAASSPCGEACDWIKHSQQAFPDETMRQFVIPTNKWDSYMLIKILQYHVSTVFVSQLSCATQDAAYELLTSALEVLFYRNDKAHRDGRRAAHEQGLGEHEVLRALSLMTDVLATCQLYTAALERQRVSGSCGWGLGAGCHKFVCAVPTRITSKIWCDAPTRACRGDPLPLPLAPAPAPPPRAKRLSTARISLWRK